MLDEASEDRYLGSGTIWPDHDFATTHVIKLRRGLYMCTLYMCTVTGGLRV
jgi:hypothetical protein